MKYPGDWFCKLCEKQFKSHLQIGEEAIEFDYLNENGGKIKVKNNNNWCFEDVPTANTEQNSWVFEPVDNLTQVELLAKQRGITKGKNPSKIPLDKQEDSRYTIK